MVGLGHIQSSNILILPHTPGAICILQLVSACILVICSPPLPITAKKETIYYCKERNNLMNWPGLPKLSQFKNFPTFPWPDSSFHCPYLPPNHKGHNFNFPLTFRWPDSSFYCPYLPPNRKGHNLNYPLTFRWPDSSFYCPYLPPNSKGHVKLSPDFSLTL